MNQSAKTPDGGLTNSPEGFPRPSFVGYSVLMWKVLNRRASKRLRDRGANGQGVAELLTDEEIRRLRLQDPDVQERLRQIHKQIDDGEPLSPGVTPQELPDFLREQRKHVDS